MKAMSLQTLVKGSAPGLWCVSQTMSWLEQSEHMLSAAVALTAGKLIYQVLGATGGLECNDTLWQVFKLGQLLKG